MKKIAGLTSLVMVRDESGLEETGMNGAEKENGGGPEAACICRRERGAPVDIDRVGSIARTGKNFGAAVRREMAAAWATCGPFEWIALGYLALSSTLIAFYAENLTHPLRLFEMQTLVSATILVLCRINGSFAGEAEQGRKSFAAKFWHFWRHWYPHLFFLFCFEELSQLVHLVNPAWEDAKLIAFDQSLTGVNPSLWLEHFANPVLNEFMQFAYFTYFLYLLILCGALYYQRDYKSYWAVMTYSAAGYVFGYVISMFFPVQSPWFTFAGMWRGELAGGPFTALVNFIEECGRVHGAAFPSQHVAGAIVALWGAWRHRRRLFWIFLPFVVCMCVSTVYVRNHYVADVFGGVVTGTLGYVIGRLMLAQSRWDSWHVGIRSSKPLELPLNDVPQLRKENDRLDAGRTLGRTGHR